MILEYYTGNTLPNGQPEIKAVSVTDPLPVSGAGGGGGGLAGVPVIDAAGVLWVRQDLGSSVVYRRLTDNMVGTPTAPVDPVIVDEGAGPVTNRTTRVTVASDGPLMQRLVNGLRQRVPGITVPQQLLDLAVAGTDAAEVTVDPGAEICLSAAVLNFLTGGTFALAFEKFDGTNWTPATVRPKAVLLAGQAPVTTATDIGMWIYTVEDGISKVRIRLTAISGLASVRVWVEMYGDGRKVHVPFWGFTGGGTYGRATGLPFIPPINWDRLGEATIDIQTLTGTGQSVTTQETADDAGVNWGGLENYNRTTNTGNSHGTTFTAGGRYRVVPTSQYFRGLLAYTTLTALNINGVTATVTSSATMPSQLPVQAVGASATGQTPNGAPVHIAGIARQTNPTAQTDARIMPPSVDKFGRTIAVPFQVRELQDNPNQTILTGTAETTFLPAIASVLQDLTFLQVESTATFTGSPTAVRVNIRPSTAGTVMFSVTIPLTPGTPIPPRAWPQPVKQAAVNNNWTAQVEFVGGTTPAIGSGDIRVFSLSGRNA